MRGQLEDHAVDFLGAALGEPVAGAPLRQSDWHLMG